MSLLCHIGVNFRSGDGQQKTNSENSIVETKAEHTEANADPFEGFAFQMWLGMQLFRLNDADPFKGFAFHMWLGMQPVQTVSFFANHGGARPVEFTVLKAHCAATKVS